MKPISPFGLPIGISITFWSIIGLIRWITTSFFQKPKKFNPKENVMKSSDVAVVLPAYNEELVIRDSIKALKKILDKKQIYVVSDGWNDRTYEIATEEGCNTYLLDPNKGKAKAMVHLIKYYNLYDKYKLIFILDADTKPDRNFLKRALPLFDDPDIGVVFASSQIKWPQHIVPKLKYYFVAYRERLNRMLQYFLLYGQTWKYTSVNYVIPGFATIYRSSVLRKLEIDTPGILIEDFNLAFQFHKKKLGKLGYSPSIIGWDQYPDNLVDYWKQVRRWNIGFFQTVRKHGVWPSFFWLTLGVFSFEVILNSIFLLFLPLIVASLLWPDILTDFYRTYIPFHISGLWYIFFTVFLTDYVLTVVIGLINKKPQLIFYGLFFFPMHYITSLILISSIIPGFFGSSSGQWVPPTRRVEKFA